MHHLLRWLLLRELWCLELHELRGGHHFDRLRRVVFFGLLRLRQWLLLHRGFTLVQLMRRGPFLGSLPLFELHELRGGHVIGDLSRRFSFDVCELRGGDLLCCDGIYGLRELRLWNHHGEQRRLSFQRLRAHDCNLCRGAILVWQ